jgi:uncharacterized lipoprotein YmbA
MTASIPSRRLILGGFAALTMLSACSASPSPRLYTLVPQPAAAVGPFVGTINVKRVDLAKYLDRIQIVRYSATYELMLSEFNLWGEDLADMVTRILVENLTTRLPGSQVYSDSTALTLPAPDVTVEIDIDHFELDPAGTVVLAAQWSPTAKDKRICFARHRSRSMQNWAIRQRRSPR